MKISTNLAVGGVAFFASGWAFAFGKRSNSFLGHSEFFLLDFESIHFPDWIFQLSVAVVSRRPGGLL